MRAGHPKDIFYHAGQPSQTSPPRFDAADAPLVIVTYKWLDALQSRAVDKA